MEVSLSRIAGAQAEEWSQQDRQFAQRQLRKIYSEQLARVMKQKKFYLLNHTNKNNIDSRIERFQQEKVDKMTRLMQQTHARKEKLIQDRVKACEVSDKRWFHKKEEIRSRVRQQEQSMVEVAKGFRLKSESYWKEREAQQRQHLRDFSAKYHRLYNSNVRTPTSPTASLLGFDHHKLNSLLEKRTAHRTQPAPAPSPPPQQIAQQRERSLRTLQQEGKLQKLMSKLRRAQLISSKQDQLRKKESLERAKMKLSQKVYRNNRPEIGEDCNKHSQHYDRFRTRTLHSPSASPSPSPSPLHRTVLSRSSSLCLKEEREQRERREQNLLQYYQKTRRLKLTKQLKLNVRSMLNSQLRHNLRKDV